MDTDRWQKIKEIFRQGLSRKPDERAAFLDKVCGDDKELRKEVQALLETQDCEDDFLKPPTVILTGYFCLNYENTLTKLG